MEPKLGVTDGKKVNILRELTVSEYQVLDGACKKLTLFLKDQHLYHIVHLNYNDYKKLLEDFYHEYIVKHSTLRRSSFEYMFLNANRYILNFLASVRSFLDHSETKLKRRYGDDSYRVERFKSVCSEIYNNSFSYRFMYKLRNYTQHCGIPVGVIAFRSEVLDLESKERSNDLVILFNRDELLANFTWGVSITKDLKKMPPRFEINPHVSEVLEKIEQINVVLIQDDLPDLIKSANYIQDSLRPLEGVTGTPCIFKIYRQDELLDMETEYIPLHIMDIVLESKNHSYPINMG